MKSIRPLHLFCLQQEYFHRTRNWIYIYLPETDKKKQLLESLCKKRGKELCSSTFKQQICICMYTLAILMKMNVKIFIATEKCLHFCKFFPSTNF